MRRAVETGDAPDDIATPPTDEHRAASFAAAAVYAAVETAKVEYLGRVRDVYEADMPAVVSPADVWDELRDPLLVIPRQFGGG